MQLLFSQNRKPLTPYRPYNFIRALTSTPALLEMLLAGVPPTATTYEALAPAPGVSSLGIDVRTETIANRDHIRYFM